MPVTYDFHLVPIDSITVEEGRQRRKLEQIDELAASIKRNGLLHPIVVLRDGKLVAGERRLTAMKELGEKEIPVHYLDELAPFEAKAIELEENIKRVNLTWKESCLAAAEYHELRKTTEDEWTQQNTADSIGLSRQHISRLLIVARALNQGNSLVAAATNFDAAYRVIKREQQRAVATEAAQIVFSGGDDPAAESKKDEPKHKLLVADFREWAKSYKGRRFNFIHCDFPYGIGYQKTGYAGSETWNKYDDSAEALTVLLDAIMKHKDKLFFPSAHLMFWLSMNSYTFVVKELTDNGFRVNPMPLIWHKDRGIIPDPDRGPRQVYETTLLASLGDRKIVKPVANATYQPVKKVGHISTKSQPMLEHFFSLVVDGLTEMLDPTCGSGSALGAAIALGAKRVVGVDINAEYIEAAGLCIKRALTRKESELDKASQGK